MRSRGNGAGKNRKQQHQAAYATEAEIMAGGIAHSFNNLFAIILGHAELALDNLSDEADCARSLKEICHAVMRGRDMVRQLLCYVPPNTERPGEVFHLAELVKETGQAMRALRLFTVEIVQHIDETNDLVRGDASELREMLANLYANAVEAMEETGGELRIELGNEEHSRGDMAEGHELKEYLAIKISDTGRGMDKETRKRAFDPFFTTRPGQRNGMGLTIARAIVRRHSGAIKVHSAVGRGASFTILLPRVRARSKG